MDGPCAGSIQNTAALFVLMPSFIVHSSKLIPIEEMSLTAVASVTPTVSHESNSESAFRAKKAGDTPPMSAPNGVATWNARGIDIAVSTVPAMAYTLAWLASRE